MNYYNKAYIEIYNKSVELDNEDYRNGGKSVNQERARKLAEDWANEHLWERPTVEIIEFLKGWYEFYYHMFD